MCCCCTQLQGQTPASSLESKFELHINVVQSINICLLVHWLWRVAPVAHSSHFAYWIAWSAEPLCGVLWLAFVEYRLCVQGLKVPVTCKIRVFPELEQTIAYARMLERAGCSILAVHGRTREQKQAKAVRANWDIIKVCQASSQCLFMRPGRVCPVINKYYLGSRLLVKSHVIRSDAVTDAGC